MSIPTAMSPPEAERLAALAKGKLVCEFGAEYGYSTTVLAGAAELVVSVDHHRGDQHSGFKGGDGTWAEFQANIAACDNVIPVRAAVEDVAEHLSRSVFGLVFIDTEHSFEVVSRHARIAAQLSETLAFHDYGRYDVAPALHAVFGRAPDELVETLAVYRRWQIG